MTTTFQQKDKGFLTYPHRTWLKMFFKAPLYLWRMGLRPLLGQVMIVISHTGRKTGLARHTMTEYIRLNGRKYAPSGFGERSQWYRNIQANPLVTIQTADGTESVIGTRVTDDDEIVALYRAFAHREPPLAKIYLDSLDINPDPSDIIAKKERIHWLRFDPTDEPTPPPLEADLVWVWPAAAALFIVLWLLKRSMRNE